MAMVLVVDDDSMVCNLAVMALKSGGYTVLSAVNGLEALMVYSSYRSRFDLVVTDLDMPQMNGIELACRIRELDPRQRVLLVTGGVIDREGTEEFPVLPKPFTPARLREAVETLLNS